MSEESEDKPIYPCDASAYHLEVPIGHGASSIVYRAKCSTLGTIVAVKILNLEKSSIDLSEIRTELHTLDISRHPNLVRSHRAFVSSSDLWIVMEYMAGGSALDLMKYKSPDGFEDEHIIATILKGALQGIEYLHKSGRIHRDVKAGNILINASGAVKLGDFGVAGLLNEGGQRKQSRQTFVGTPCWMAPEVMEQVHGYDFRADIWSFGITAIELANGHAPLAKHPPMKVLLLTLQNPPPTLAGNDPKSRFSKAYRDLVHQCLQKDPEGRPSASKLLEHRFFKSAKKPDYVLEHLLVNLPDMSVRAQTIHKKALEKSKVAREAASHQRGLSGDWIFPEDEDEDAPLAPSTSEPARADVGEPAEGGNNNTNLLKEGRSSQEREIKKDSSGASKSPSQKSSSSHSHHHRREKELMQDGSGERKNGSAVEARPKAAATASGLTKAQRLLNSAGASLSAGNLGSTKEATTKKGRFVLSKPGAGSAGSLTTVGTGNKSKTNPAPSGSNALEKGKKQGTGAASKSQQAGSVDSKSSSAGNVSSSKKKGRFIVSPASEEGGAASNTGAGSKQNGRSGGHHNRGGTSMAGANAGMSVVSGSEGGESDGGGRPRGSRTVGQTIKTLLQKSRQHTAMLQGIQQAISQQQQQEQRLLASSAALNTSLGSEDPLILVTRLKDTVCRLVEENQKLRDQVAILQQENTRLKGNSNPTES